MAVTEFAVNLLLASLATTLTLTIARRQHMLVDAATPFAVTSSRTRGIFSLVVILLSIVAAAFSPTNAKFVWLLLAFAPRANRLVERRLAAAESSGGSADPEVGSGSGVGPRSRGGRGSGDRPPDPAPAPDPDDDLEMRRDD